MRLFLVRHGESEGNARRVFQGRLDYGLTPRGELQARSLAGRLSGMEVVHFATSPQRRARLTAEILGSTLGRTAVPLPELSEYDIGEPSGLTVAEVRERYPGILEAQRRGERVEFPGEEGRAQFQSRVRRALDFLTAFDGDVVAVTHGGVVSAVCHMVTGVDLVRRGVFHVGNCSLTVIERDRRGRLVLARHNDGCHLDGLATAFDTG